MPTPRQQQQKTHTPGKKAAVAVADAATSLPAAVGALTPFDVGGLRNSGNATRRNEQPLRRGEPIVSAPAGGMPRLDTSSPAARTSAVLPGMRVGRARRTHEGGSQGSSQGRGSQADNQGAAGETAGGNMRVQVRCCVMLRCVVHR